MFPLHYLVLFYLWTSQATVFISPQSLYDITRGKPVLKRRSNQAQHPVRGFRDVCGKLYPVYLGKSDIYLLDFRDIYPIILINMTVYSETKIAGSVKVSIDKQNCTVQNLKNGENLFVCFGYVTGRVLSIQALVDVTICSVQVFTCSAGKRGPTCNNQCAHGTYGVACRPCNCGKDESCRKFDGFCPSGCKGVHSEMRYDCYYNSILRDDDGHLINFTQEQILTVTFLPTYKKDKIVLRKQIDAPLVKESCAVITSEDNSRSAAVEYLYAADIIIYSVDIMYCDFAVPSPYSIHISLNGHSCYGQTLYEPLSLGAYTLVCQRKGITGNTLRISHTSYDLSSNTTLTVGIRLNEVRVSGCKRGFYGARCKLRCNCLGSICDFVTGFCPTQTCGAFAKGRNCALINLAQEHQVLVDKKIRNSLTVEKSAWKLKSPNFHPSVYDESVKELASWWVIQLDGIYHIKGITLTIKQEQIINFRQFAVFIDTEPQLSNYSDPPSHYWRGLGCRRDLRQPEGITIDVNCVGPARTITIVAYSLYPFISAAVQNVEVWSCMDGTFGKLCEATCNCKNETEVCNMVTGECFSGCADGYGGNDCQVPCAETGVNTCWNVCRCSEISSGCGPGVVMCGENKCTEGWMGVACDIPCPIGWYGLSCGKKCGACRNDDQNLSCNPVNGFCLNGCLNGMVTPTCKIEIDRTKKAVVSQETFATFKIIIYGVVISVLLFLVLVLCCRLVTTKNTGSSELLRDPKSSRKKKSGDVNEQIMRSHRDYHEDYVQKKALQDSKTPAKQSYLSYVKDFFSFDKGGLQYGDKDLNAKTMFGGMREGYRKRSVVVDRCAPLENNTKQDSDQKVALWIIREDFNEVITRRQEKLKQYRGDIIYMKDSTASICPANLSKEELDKLYDEVGLLGIP